MIVWLADWLALIEWLIDKLLTDWLTDWLTEWFTDWLISHWLMDWQSEWRNDWLQTNETIDHVISFWLDDHWLIIFFLFPLGVSLNMWRFDDQTKKLYISRSFVFTNLQVSYCICSNHLAWYITYDNNNFYWETELLWPKCIITLFSKALT